MKKRHWLKEENPSRPKLSASQYERMLVVAPEVDWRFEVALVLAHETRHRIGSIRQLRWSDSIALDIMGSARRTTRSAWSTTRRPPRAIRALQKARAMNPEGEWTFPHPRPDHAGESCFRFVMQTWWDEAREKVCLGATERLGWHSVRRKFANDLRHVPLKDLAQLGGWKDINTIVLCYLSEDMDAMREALATRRSYGSNAYGEEERGTGRQSA